MANKKKKAKTKQFDPNKKTEKTNQPTAQKTNKEATKVVTREENNTAIDKILSELPEETRKEYEKFILEHDSIREKMRVSIGLPAKPLLMGAIPSDNETTIADAVLATKLTPEVVLATYEDHRARQGEALRYERKQAEESGVWKKYFKLRGLSAHIPAKITNMLALLKYPELYLHAYVEVDSEQGCVVWSFVYASFNDFEWSKSADGKEFWLDTNGNRVPGGKILARDVKTKGATQTDFIEKAVTGAHSRALARLGFGTAAGIAALEDVQAAEYSKGRPSTTTEQPRAQTVDHDIVQEDAPEDMNQDQPLEREQAYGKTSNDAEGFKKWEAEKAKEKHQATLLKFYDYLDKRVATFKRDEVAAKYGKIEDMNKDDLVRVHSELEKFRSRGKWLQAMEEALPAEVVALWREHPGGTEKEQALGWLQALHDSLGDQSTVRPYVLGGQTEVQKLDEDLALVPIAGQIDSFMEEFLPTLGIKAAQLLEL